MVSAPPEARTGTANPPAKERSRLSYSRFLVINVIVLVVVVAAGVFVYNYVSNVQSYVSTDNANIDGIQVSVVAPATGVLISWDGVVGTTAHQGDVIGQIQPVPGPTGLSKPVAITAPQDGTVVVSGAVPNTFVVPGTPLAITYNLQSLFVTARVQETDINNVKTGQTVDINVDAFPNTTLTGTVAQIGYAASSVFSILPPSNTTGNYQKVTQVIPVMIKIDDQVGLRLVPGMNCSVRIHK